MPSMNKEEARVEKIIRGLLKLPENKKCINCNSLGPQYVCTTFWTFICTNCSGIHREFTHRVKSVSMATFSMEEVNALKAGGNERAREIYFKTIDAHRNAVTDSSNLHRLREFIKNVYVDRKYTDDQGADKLAMVKVDAIDDDKDKHSGAERSNQLALVEQSGHHSSERSTRKSRDEVSRSDLTEKPTRSARDAFLEIFSNGPFSERPQEITRDHSSFERPRGTGKNDNLERHSLDTPSRVVRDDFMERHSFENYSQGTRDEFPERNSNRSSMRNKSKDTNSRNYLQDDAKSRSRRPRFEIVDDRFRDDDNKNVRHSESVKYLNTRHNVGNASPDSQKQKDIRKPLAICPAEEALDKKSPPPNAGESPRSIDERCSPEFPTVQKENDDPNQDSTIGEQNDSNKAPPTSLLDSDSKPETASTIDIDETKKTSPIDEGEKKASTVDNVDALNVNPLESLLLDWPAPSNNTPENSTSTLSSVDGYIPSDTANQTIEALPDNKNDLRSEVQQGVAPDTKNDLLSEVPQGVAQETKNDLLFEVQQGDTPNQVSTNSLRTDQSQNFQQALETSGSEESQASKRKELPADLFSGSFAPFPAPVPGWQLHPPHLMGYGMQYQLPATRNPFDVGADGTQIAPQMFSHIPPLPVVQPNMIVPAGFHNQESSHPFSWQAQQYPYGVAAAPGSHYDAMNNSNAAFSPLHPSQQLPSTHSTPPHVNNAPTTGGNPFG